MTLTAVIPFRRLSGATPWRGRDLRRLRRLLRVLPDAVTPLVVDDTACPRLRAQTRAMMAQTCPRARLTPSPDSAAAPFSVGLLRDRGVAAADDGVVMFHDVDFIAPRRTYEALAARAPALLRAAGPDAFLCAPVHFLTPLGAVALRSTPRSAWVRLATPAASPLRMRLVMGSSAIIATRAALRACGGHDPGFSGHGAEDFDLMDRLSQVYPMGPRPADYHSDAGPGAQAGFRAYFARYGAPLWREGLALAHQWHPPRRADPRYIAARTANFTRLADRMATRVAQAPPRSEMHEQ